MKAAFLFTLLLLTTSAHADPQLTSWYVAQTGKYARIVETDAELLADSSKTTWTRTSGPNTTAQTTPVYAGPQQVDYSSSWVYLRTPSLSTFTMGPWYNNAAKSALFVSLPKNQGFIVRFPRTSTLGSIPTTKTATAGLNVGGVMQPATGYHVDGVCIFDPTDGFSYSGGTETSPGTGSWHRDAYANELPTVDKSFQHQQNLGVYHSHMNPIALRYQLGDAVAFNSTTKEYSETLAPTAHSPIVGWMLDGLPVYGPYGYSSALDSSSSVRRMVSGFVKRDGTTTGVDNITTAGRNLPAWATRNGVASATGPTVSTTYPLGRYVEDYAYLGDLIKTGSTKYALGTDFDLNEYNVRYCVTPEFPSGTWAYFVNITSTGTPQFPYMINRWFYGTPTGGTVTSISEIVTNQFTGGANRPLSISNTAVSGTSVTLTWNAAEGGTYSVDASQNNSTWTSKATGFTLTKANSKSNTHTALGTTGTEYARVNRTALATYDSTGTVAAITAQTTSTSFSLGTPNTAPTLTTISTLSLATEDTPFTISYATLADAADEADVDGNAISFRIEAVSSGTLTKSGTAVTAGSTLLSTSESLVWTPASNANGTLAAFTVKAYDGTAASSTAIQVNVLVIPDNDAPTLTTVSTLTGATEDTAFSIPFATLTTAADEADVDNASIYLRIESVTSGTLTVGGTAVTPGSTLLFMADTLVWTPAANANGTLAAFTIKASDGLLTSSTAVQVNVSVAAADDGTIWDGSAGTSAWGTSTNWIDDALPGTSAVVQFAGASPYSIALGANRSVNSVTFSGTTGYTLSGNTLTLSGSTITANPPASGTATHIISSALSLSSAATASVGSNATLVLSGGVAGSITLTKTGNGTLTLSSAASASSLLVNEGIVSTSSSSNLADTMDVYLVDGTKLNLNFSGTDTIHALYVNGVLKNPGIYGGPNSGAGLTSSLFSGSGLLHVSTGNTIFATWATTKGLTAANNGFAADPDHDGLSNGLEYALGGNPLVADSRNLQPTSTLSSSYLTLTFYRSDDSENDVEVRAEYSTDLSSWSDVQVGSVSGINNNVIITVTENGTSADLITVQIPVGTNAKLFARISADED